MSKKSDLRHVLLVKEGRTPSSKQLAPSPRPYHVEQESIEAAANWGRDTLAAKMGAKFAGDRTAALFEAKKFNTTPHSKFGSRIFLAGYDAAHHQKFRCPDPLRGGL